MMFNEYGQQMRYDWSDPEQPFEQIHGPSEQMHTACLPSIIEHEMSELRFISEFTTAASLQQVFENFPHEFIEEYEVEALPFEVANQTWLIEVNQNGMLDNATFSEFCKDLHFEPFDHVMVSVSSNKIVRVITLQSGDGSKKMLNWFCLSCVRKHFLMG